VDISGNLTGSTSTADIYNSIFEKCSRTVQRELNIEVFWNRVSRFKRKLLPAVAKQVKDDDNSMPRVLHLIEENFPT
jgi:hypothetical protein